MRPFRRSNSSKAPPPGPHRSPSDAEVRQGAQMINQNQLQVAQKREFGCAMSAAAGVRPSLGVQALQSCTPLLNAVLHMAAKAAV